MNMRIRLRLQRLEKTAIGLRRDVEANNLSMQQVLGALLASDAFDEFGDLARKEAMFGTLTADEQKRSESLFWAAMVQEFGPEIAAEPYSP